MAKLATCPGCTTQLALPEEATLSDRARCPRCHEEFLLMETVQFSIPTAEILLPAEPEVVSPTDTLSPPTFSPESVAHFEPSVEDRESVSKTQDVGDAGRPQQELESTPSPLPMSATLSDWEARLKRAIAADVDDDTPTQVSRDSRFESNDPAISEPTGSRTPIHAPQDFEVPEADLMPEAQSEPTESRVGGLFAEDTFEDDEEPTVRFASDQTVSIAEIGQIPQDAQAWPEEPIAVRADVAPRRKKKRSLARTLASTALGVVGIPLGLYALLWLKGPGGDMLQIAEYLPSFMLPSSFDEFDPDARERIAQQETPPLDDEPEESIDAFEPNGIADAEPLVREDPAVAQASAEEPAYQDPKFALIDGSEFSELLTAAQQLAPQLMQGDLKSKESVASKGQAYMALARLADKSSFLNQPGHTPDDVTNAMKAEELFQTTLRDEIVRRDLPQIALRWWQYAERPSPGIVLIGHVRRLQTTDAGTLAFVSLGDGVAPEIAVLVGNVEHREGDLIGVAGSIETDLGKWLPALDVALGSVVVAHYSFPVFVPEERTFGSTNSLHLRRIRPIL